MDKQYKVYVSKTMIEDNFAKGEIGNRIDVFGPTLYGRDFTLKGALNAASNNLFGEYIDFKQCSNIINTTTLLWSRIETGDENKPTIEQEALWKKGEYKMFAADYEFKIVIEEEASKEEIEKELGITIE